MTTTTTEDKGPPPQPPATRSKGRAAKLAADVSERGFGVDPDAADGDSRYGWLRLAGLIGVLVFVGFRWPWVLIVILGLGLMIALHEFGHFITAKRAGMKVTEFFLGFGPKIWSTRRGETEYGIKVIPAGAYVKIIGMSNLEDVKPADEGRTYRQKGLGARLSVAVAGSAMHFLLAFVLIFVALSVVGQPGGTLNPQKAADNWRIGQVNPGTGAAAAGLKKGDKILTVDGQKTTTFDDLRTITKPRKGETVPVTYERNGTRRAVKLTLKPYYSWFISRVVSGTDVADKLQPGDEIISIDGALTRTRRDLDSLLVAKSGDKVPVTYERGDNGPKRSVDVRLSSLILSGYEGYIGIGRDVPPIERLNPLKGLVRTPVEFASVTVVSVQALGRFFTPSGLSDFAGQIGHAQTNRKSTKVSTSTTSSSTLAKDGAGVTGQNRLLSIYGLVRIGSDIGKVDPGGLIALFALVNIFIGMFNLVPLLPFDGGHVVIALYEKAQELRQRKRRYFADVGKMLPLTYVVVVLLMMLFISTIYLDIANPLSVR